MISRSAQSALDELNEIIRLDGGELRLRSSTDSQIELWLDLSNSDCPDCVLPRDLLLDLLRTRLTEADPDITIVHLDDPRVSGDHPVSDH